MQKLHRSAHKKNNKKQNPFYLDPNAQAVITACESLGLDPYNIEVSKKDQNVQQICHKALENIGVMPDSTIQILERLKKA